jgi:hypothetical protein
VIGKENNLPPGVYCVRHGPSGDADAKRTAMPYNQAKMTYECPDDDCETLLTLEDARRAVPADNPVPAGSCFGIGLGGDRAIEIYV